MRIKQLLTGSMIAAALVTGATVAAPAAVADLPNCQTVPWGFLGLGSRTLCDSTLYADGSWVRGRQFWYPAYQVPLTCYGNAYYASCTGGYWVPETRTQVEVYPVTPDTVLGDEPGHLGAGALR